MAADEATQHGLEQLERSLHELVDDNQELQLDLLFQDAEEDVVTMAAFSRDPREFTPKIPAPTFDIDTQRHEFLDWKDRWDGWLIITGIKKLCLVDPEGDGGVTAELVAAVNELKVGALKQAWTTSTNQVLRGLALTTAQRADPEQVIAAVEAHIDGATNKRVYRSELARKTRAQGESYDNFVIALRDIASKCKFVLPTSQMELLNDRLIDAIISNVNDTEVAERLLQLKDGATLQEVSGEARAIFSARKDSRALCGGGAAAARFVQKNPDRRTNDKNERNKPASGPDCPKCGRNQHRDGQKCPADAAHVWCHSCGQPGHFDKKCPMGGGSAGSAVALSGSIASTTTMDPTAKDYRELEPLKPLQMATLVVSTVHGDYKAEVPCLMDTGANLTCMPADTLRKLKLPLTKLSNKTARIPPPMLADGAVGATKYMGTFRGKLSTGGNETEADVYVFEGLAQPLISRDACLDLKAF